MQYKMRRQISFCAHSLVCITFFLHGRFDEIVCSSASSLSEIAMGTLLCYVSSWVPGHEHTA